MTIEERRVKVIAKMLDDEIMNKVALEMGLEIKEIMLIQMGDNPSAQKVEEAIRMERMQLAMQPKVIDILQRKLKEAENDCKTQPDRV